MPIISIEDRLKAARASRVFVMEIAGTSLDIHKWDLDGVIAKGEILMDVIKLLSDDTRIKAIRSLWAQLAADPKAFIGKYKTAVQEVLAQTVLEGNFNNLDEARQWVQALGFDDFAWLTKTIFEKNLIPFADKLGLKLRLPASLKASTTQPATSPQTSSPISSQPATPT